MKILIVALNAKYIHSNLAVYTLRSYAEKKFIKSDVTKMRPDIQIAEYTVNQPVMGILSDIYTNSPDAVFFSCYIWNIEKIRELLDDIRKVMPKTYIWLGGPEVSFYPYEVMSQNISVDGIICGEGEETFFQLSKVMCISSSAQDGAIYSRLSEIEGIVFRNEYGKVIENPKRRPVDMDDIPFPYEKMEDFKNRIVYYESSRGCPFRCSYCLSSIDRSLRFRDIEMVKNEILYFLENNVKQVKFIDRTFNCDRQRAVDIWKFIKEHDNGTTNFHFEIAGDILDEEEIEILSNMRVGNIQLEIGVQSSNEDTLCEINRNADLGKLKENVGKIIKNGNINIHLDLIAGLPFEDIESFEKSFNEVYAMKPHQLQLGFLKVLKGTDIEKKRTDYGFKYTSKPPYEILETKWITYGDLKKLKDIEEMVERYYNSRQFTKTLELLSGKYESPFAMFAELARWYEKHEKAMINISRQGRYKKLIAFARQYVYEIQDEEFERFKDAVAVDYYSRDNDKSRPAFLKERGVSKEEEKAFYTKEEKMEGLLKETVRNLSDVRRLRGITHIEKVHDGYIIFDYTKRDPVTGNVHMIKTEKL